MSMQPQMYPGGEYAPHSQYPTAGMQGTHGPNMAVHGPQQMHVPPVPSGYPAHALPGSRISMRGPGPSMAMHGQQYGSQQSVVTMPPNQQAMPMQVYGPQAPNTAMAGPLPQQAAPQTYGGQIRHTSPSYGLYPQNYNVQETGQRFVEVARQPNPGVMRYRYPGAPNATQVNNEQYRPTHQMPPTTYPGAYYPQRAQSLSREGYGYCDPSGTQYPQNIQQSHAALHHQSPDNQPSYPNVTPNTMTTPSYRPVNANAYMNPNSAQCVVPGPAGPGTQAPSQSMYPQFNANHPNMIPPNQRPHMVSTYCQPNNPVQGYPVQHTQVQPFNVQGNSANAMHQNQPASYGSNPLMNSGQTSNPSYARYAYPQHQNMSQSSVRNSFTQHSSMTQGMPHPNRYRQPLQMPPQQFPQVPSSGNHQNNDIPEPRPNIQTSNVTCVVTATNSNMQFNEVAQTATMSEIPKHLENIRDSIDSTCSVTWEESPLDESGTESTHQPDEETMEGRTDTPSTPFPHEQTGDNMTREELPESKDDNNQDNCVESSDSISSNVNPNSDESVEQRPVTLVDDDIKDENVQIDINSQFTNQKAPICPSVPSTSHVPMEHRPSSSESFIANQHETAAKEHVIVPWGWRRIITPELVIYVR